MTKLRPRDRFAVPSFAPCLLSGLKSIDRFLHARLPATAKRLVQADDGEKPCELGLPQRVFRLEQGELGVEHGHDVSGSSAQLLFSKIECAPRSNDDVA